MATDDYPEILTAIDFNTMSLFKFERDLSTDKILYSEYFLHLLFNLLMGPKPNIWTASNKPDPLPETSLISKDKYGSFNKIFLSNWVTSKSGHRAVSVLQTTRVKPRKSRTR